MSSLNKDNFLQKYNINEEDFVKSGLLWDELCDIYNDFNKLSTDYEAALNFVINKFRQVKNIHLIRSRIKQPEHVIEKIIRKRIEIPDRDINITNYTTELTDLLGIRIIHLFKEEWRGIHEYLKDWNFHEDPVAYIRKGDKRSFKEQYLDASILIKEHKYNYRSVHYTLDVELAGTLYIIEVQVRTIFEESWSEIDHRIRYPYYVDNSRLNEFSSLLNRFAGQSDEFASLILAEKLTIENKKDEKEIELPKDIDLISSLSDSDLNRLIQQLSDLGYYKNAIELLKFISQKSAKRTSFLKLAELEQRTAVHLRHNGEYKECLSHYKKSAAYLERSRNQEVKSKILEWKVRAGKTMVNSYIISGNSIESLSEYNKIATEVEQYLIEKDLNEKDKSKIDIYLLHLKRQIAEVNRMLGSYQKSLEYFNYCYDQYDYNESDAKAHSALGQADCLRLLCQYEKSQNKYVEVERYALDHAKHRLQGRVLRNQIILNSSFQFCNSSDLFNRLKELSSNKHTGYNFGSIYFYLLLGFHNIDIDNKKSKDCFNQVFHHTELSSNGGFIKIEYLYGIFGLAEYLRHISNYSEALPLYLKLLSEFTEIGLKWGEIRSQISIDLINGDANTSYYKTIEKQVDGVDKKIINDMLNNKIEISDILRNDLP